MCLPAYCWAKVIQMKEFIKKQLSPYYKIKKKNQEQNFRKRLSILQGDPIKVVIGSGGIYEKDWIPSEAHFLNLLDESTWIKYFQENEIQYLLAEHVWEHLTLDQGKIASDICYKYLRNGGRLRVAVPDGFHKDQKYIDYVKPGGSGAGADDHKVLYNYETLSSVFTESGFEVELLEYFDSKKQFHGNKWGIDQGYVRRSLEHDKRNASGEPNYTSLIIDAIKI